MKTGYYRIADAVHEGKTLYDAKKRIRTDRLQRVAHGIYVLPETWPDELYELQLANTKVIFSHETALFLHDLTDREPDRIAVTVKRGYNTKRLLEKGIEVHTVRAEWYELGLEKAETSSGNPVRLYDKERCICDAVRNKKKMDVQVFQSAIRSYFASPEKDIHKLMQYSKVMGLENEIRIYTEVML